MDLSDKTIAVIGLGYVGLPLAVEFGKLRPVVGFDVRHRRVAELREGFDATREMEPDELAAADHLRYSSTPEDLRECGVFIVSVPTPVDQARRPDMSMLETASATVGRAIRPGAVVVYESTVYPGCTRNICVPILERMSGLTFNREFFAGYSPERINPGDRMRRLPNIVKVTSGSTPEAADAVDELYRTIVPAGTHKASSIEVAEAAKVIENTQRDLNIAFVNELAIIFHRLGLDTREVLSAAATKWNFLPFQPGLVGGHCIGVDPYYLTHRAEEIGYHPEVILAGRRINDAMGRHVADRVVRMMLIRDMPVSKSRILVLGITFKENCPDVRNSRVQDVIAAFRELNASVDAWDPCADIAEVPGSFGANLLAQEPPDGHYDSVVLAVSHRQFVAMGADRIRRFGKPGAVFFDVKSTFGKDQSDGRL
jgi:UDP-N-acetyl-D-glucosamine/UDP-N-acetyl-D-galactosamine dehydrogenase